MLQLLTYCQRAGFPPPVEAYGALLQAYTRKNNAVAALDLLAEFRQQGGEIDEWLVSMTVTACVRAGEFRKALRVRSSSPDGRVHLEKCAARLEGEVVPMG